MNGITKLQSGGRPVIVSPNRVSRLRFGQCLKWFGWRGVQKKDPRGHFYRLFGINRLAERDLYEAREHVQAEYKRRMKLCHPDLNGDDEEAKLLNAVKDRTDKLFARVLKA